MRLPRNRQSLLRQQPEDTERVPINASADIQEVTPSGLLGYDTETGPFTEDEWNDIVFRFDDATLSQTWSYGAVRWGANNLSHLVLKKDGEVIAATQVIITKVRILNAGLAYVKGGPLWCRQNAAPDLEVLRQMLAALRQTYATDRGLLLRIFPSGTEDGTGGIRELFREEGFSRDLTIGVPKTVIIDLSHSLEDLRRSLKPTWRRNLVLAERNDLRVIEGSTNELFDTFAGLYKEMLRRKSIVGVVNIRHYQQVQRRLPDSLKMRVLICEHQGNPVAGVVVPTLGKSTPNLLAATGDKGLELRASYLLQWKVVEWLKREQYQFYDLDAINHDNYPGISQFKLGLGGRLGWEAENIGQFQYCDSARSALCVEAGEMLRTIYRGFQRIASRSKRLFASSGRARTATSSDVSPG